MASITPFLWFDNNLEQAIEFYKTVFTDAVVTAENRNGEGAPGLKADLFTAEFELAGQKFIGLNGGPHFAFTEAVSFFISCETQEEVDYYWDALLANGGSPSQCGWLKDQFGLSWQVVPAGMGALLSDPDREKANRTMQAMMQMVKLDLPTLQRAFNGQ